MTGKNKPTREEILARWENARQRKHEHIAKIEEELNKELTKIGKERVTLEVW